MSILVEFQIYSTSGIFAVSDDFTTSVMCGITSPERIILIIEPIPILLSFINLALKPVAYSILAPPNVTGSILTRGFKYPSLLGVQITSTTFVSTI